MRTKAPTSRVCFRLRALVECRPLALDIMATVLAHVRNADATFRDEMITAFGEAFYDIITYAYPGRADGMVDVEAEMSDDHMTLRMKDKGQSVDGAVHATVDEVVYRAGDPNVLTLTKRTRRRR